MGTAEILALGVALSMDAFAVTVSDMFAYKGITKKRAMLLPLFFGAFQGLMPLIGYYAGRLVADFIETYAGIITLVILGFIGGKMIIDAAREMHATRKAARAVAEASTAMQATTSPTQAPAAVGQAAGHTSAAAQESAAAEHVSAEAPHPPASPAKKKLTIRVILFQAIATSIDALMVGVSLAAQGTEPFSACGLIALTTFCLSCLAVFIGERFGMKLGEKATMVGGIVLVAIGIKAMF